MVQDIKTWLRANKEGLIIGALAGLGYTIYLGSTGADLNFIVSAHKAGLADQIIAATATAKDVALTKVGMMFITIGALIGGIIDHVFYPNK